MNEMKRAIDEAMLVAVEEALERWQAEDAKASTEQTQRMVKVYTQALADQRRVLLLRAEEYPN